MQHQALSNIRAFAQDLRRNMTDSERRLWTGLRAEQLGFKFRRQHPLGRYIADFACLSPKLIIELDGGQHRDAQAYDQQRDAFFRVQGFEVLRFPSNAPLMALDGVLQAVFNCISALAALAAPIPAFPQRGKEQQPNPFLLPEEQQPSCPCLLPEEQQPPPPCLSPLGEGVSANIQLTKYHHETTH